MAIYKTSFTRAQIEQALYNALNIISEGKSFNLRGEWMSEGSYSNTESTIDVVIYDGVSYYCRTTHNGRTTPPDEDTTYWGQLAGYEPLLKNAPEEEIADDDGIVFIDSSDNNATKIITFEDFKMLLPAGGGGAPIQLRVTATHIQWRAVGETDWADLVPLSAITGPQGEQGPKGDSGAKGEKGDKGDKGDTGNGIASAVLNEDYTLTLTFTDGTSYTTPSIRGAKGDKGDKGDKGEKGDKGDPGEKGDKGDGLEFNWNGTQLGIRVEGEASYQYVNLKGEKGDTGSKGERGDDGRGIVSIARTSGTGAAGTTDTYTITFTDSTTSTFQVYNGADGEGSGDMRMAVYDTDADGKVNAADTADSVPWSGVQNKPSSFNPSSHTHTKSDISDFSHTHTKSEVGLGNVDNVKQMPISGGTFTGKAYAQSNTDYTTAQIRNIVLSTSDPSGGNNGDIWIKYS